MSADRLRVAIDTGGTFTDLVIESPYGQLDLFKAATTTDDPVRGVLDVVRVAAEASGETRRELLGRIELLLHGTTHALNAMLGGATARTALLVTEGHEDLLVMREGGRIGAFDFTREYPQPYIPRSLTFGIRERIGAAGEVVVPLDSAQVASVVEGLARERVEAVAVCLLWAIANPEHELAVAALVRDSLPDVPITLSHVLNPTIREYRRASSTAIDASLRPLMGEYLRSFDRRLRDAGFSGRALMVTSGGGLLELEMMADSPVHALKSGPSMAPVAGRGAARRNAGADTAIVVDCGGTSFDVSLVRSGQISRTNETWIGPRFEGVMTGFHSVDVRSIGAGGGSIARVDRGGLLHVGPESAGADPGPACYGHGGHRPTVTDAAVVLGYLDPERFLGGAMPLQRRAAVAAVSEQVAEPLGVEHDEAAAAILEVANEKMVQAIEEITVRQGIDPTEATIVAGGGAAGLSIGAIARRLGCPQILIPSAAAALSAAGALASDLQADFYAAQFATTAEFERLSVNEMLKGLARRCEEFLARLGSDPSHSRVDYFAQARYPGQVWEIELPLRSGRFDDASDVQTLSDDFHRLHREVFAVSQPDAPVEIVGWRASAVYQLPRVGERAPSTQEGGEPPPNRDAWFPGLGRVSVPVLSLELMTGEDRVRGPAFVESKLTTVVVAPDHTARRLETGTLSIVTGADRPEGGTS